MRIYYGWIIVAASLVILTLAMGATFHSFGVFVRPVSEELGLSRADANSGLILFSIGGAVCAPILGKLMDRLPIRNVMLVCAVLIGASLVCLGVSRALWLSALVLTVPLAIGVQGATISATTVVARWFTVHRGRAMAIALFGMSLAGVLVTPAIAFGVERLQWRDTLILAGVAAGVALLAMALLIREKPGPNDIESTRQRAAQPDAAPATQSVTPFAALALLSMPQFWAIGLATAATFGLTSAVMVSLVPLAEAAGVGATQAASLIAILAAGGFAGGLVVAWIADRVDRLSLLAVLFLVVAACAALFYFSHSFQLLAVGAALWGFTTGIASPAFYALLADRFGPASFGTAYGLMSVLMTVLAAVATRYAGEVYDRTGTYDWLFLAVIGVELMAAALIFGARLWSAPPVGAAEGGASMAHH